MFDKLDTMFGNAIDFFQWKEPNLNGFSQRRRALTLVKLRTVDSFKVMILLSMALAAGSMISQLH